MYVFVTCYRCTNEYGVGLTMDCLDELIEVGPAVRNELLRQGWGGTDEQMLCPSCARKAGIGEDDDE